MNRLFISIVLIAIAGGSLLTWQATRSGTSVVFMPSELAKLPKNESRIRIRVAGKVTTDEYRYELQPKFLLSFQIKNPGRGKEEVHGGSTSPDEAAILAAAGSIPVVYEGIKPDMFASGRDVIVDGDFKNGVLEAHKLLTQCPSKYEPPSPTGEAGAAAPNNAQGSSSNY